MGRGSSPEQPVVVRTQSRSAARALLQDLVQPTLPSTHSSTTTGPARLTIASYGERLPWACRPTVAVYLGVPSPWRRACLMGGEATEHVLVVDPDEKQWATRVLDGLAAEWQTVCEQTADDLGFDRPDVVHLPPARTIYGPLTIDDRGEEHKEHITPLPALDLERMFAGFVAAVSKIEDGDDESGTTTGAPIGGRSVLARPITLEPGYDETGSRRTAPLRSLSEPATAPPRSPH